MSLHAVKKKKKEQNWQLDSSYSKEAQQLHFKVSQVSKLKRVNWEMLQAMS